LIAGDQLEFYLAPRGGELPPGLTLSRSGRITGFTDPIFALEYTDSPTGAYDSGAFDIVPLDVAAQGDTGYDSYIYDFEDFDFNEPSRGPRRLSRFYSFIVAVSDGIHEIRRIFRIWVVTEEFLTADNTLLQVDTNLFQASGDDTRKPIWITESNLGRIRANNYVTIFLDVYDPPSLEGTIIYFKLPSNPDGSASEFPPGMTLDQVTGDIAGRVPYQSAVTKHYQFTLQAVNFPPILFDENYDLVGDWSATVSYQQNQAVRYQGFIWLCIEPHRNRRPEIGSAFWDPGVSTAEKTFTVDIIGEIESAIAWITEEDLGIIPPNIPSQFYVEASASIYGGRLSYEQVSGELPPGLELIPNGQIQGKVKQFGDSKGPGLTRFYERVDSAQTDSTRSFDYNVTWDGSETSFDRLFTFTVKAKDIYNAAESFRTFFIHVDVRKNVTFANLYAKAFQSKDKRLEWYNFITDSDVFRESEIYRFGDPNFGIQSEIKMLIYAGIESREAEFFIQAMSRNHYRKQVRFGDVKFAVAKNLVTQEVIYEVIYVDIIDEYEKNGKSISRVIELSDNINSRVLVSYDAIKVDSDIPLASERDHQRIFPNSYKNMRKQIQSVGDREREFLPLWMRSIQPGSFVEPGYVKSVVLCYLKPGFSPSVISRIRGKTDRASRGTYSNLATYRVGESVEFEGDYYTCIHATTGNAPPNNVFWSKNFNFKDINFTIDRYLIDALGGELENKYLAFKQRGEKLP
jgi:hypothetical protein